MSIFNNMAHYTKVRSVIIFFVTFDCFTLYVQYLVSAVPQGPVDKAPFCTTCHFHMTSPPEPESPRWMNRSQGSECSNTLYDRLSRRGNHPIWRKQTYRLRWSDSIRRETDPLNISYNALKVQLGIPIWSISHKFQEAITLGSVWNEYFLLIY